MVEPYDTVAFGGHSTTVVCKLTFRQVVGIIADIKSTEAITSGGGVVQFDITSIIVRGVDKHVEVGHLYLIDNKVTGIGTARGHLDGDGFSHLTAIGARGSDSDGGAADAFGGK